MAHIKKVFKELCRLSVSVRSVNRRICLHRPYVTSSICMNRSFKPGLTNPLDDFKAHIQVPILDEKDWSFIPQPKYIDRVQSHFKSTDHNTLLSTKGVGDFEDLPDSGLPEVAFIGKSNVGKSSLIKAIFFNTSDAKIGVSKKPGHTTAIKLYWMKKFCLVDMPGYGRNMPGYYQQSVEDYLNQRKNLCRTFILVDSATGITSVDKVGIEMMEEYCKPYCVVFTKIDKCTLRAMFKRLDEFKTYREKNMRGCLPQPFLVSSTKDIGIGFLRSFVAHVTGLK